MNANASVKWKAVRIFMTAAYLLPGWILFTGTVAPYPLALGIVFSFAVACFTYGFFIDEREAGRRALLPRFHILAAYLVFLMFSMYASGFRVLLLVIGGRINPRIVHFRTRLKSDIARVVLSGSITITPGTISLLLDDDHLLVHWLDTKTTHSRYAGELIKGRMEKFLEKIWI